MIILGKLILYTNVKVISAPPHNELMFASTMGGRDTLQVSFAITIIILFEPLNIPCGLRRAGRLVSLDMRLQGLRSPLAASPTWLVLVRVACDHIYR